MIYDVCIIGGGPAGIYAGYCCGTSGLSFCIIDALDSLGGQCFALYSHKEIYGIPGFVGVTAGEFIEKLKYQASIFDHDIYLNSPVTCIKKLEEKYKIFITPKDVEDQSRTIESRYIILATGIGSMKPNIPQNISNINELSNSGHLDVYNCNYQKYCNKNIAVAGGGDSAADFAIDCSRYAEEITIIHRREQMTCQEDKKEKILKIKNINLLMPNQIISITPQVNDCSSLHIETNTVNIVCDKIVLCYGFSTKSSILGGLEDIGCNIDNSRVIVNIDNMETDAQGCYAIGDIAAYKNKKKNVTNCFFEGARAVRDIKTITKAK